jgi:hypothetical protein
VTLESAEFLLRFSPERVVARLAPRPLLIVNGARNALHEPVEAQSMYDHAAEPKRRELLEGRGHNEWMFDDNPTFTRVVGLLDEFLTGVWSLDAGQNGRCGPRDDYAAGQ